jgi:hypothetical protein
MKRETSGYIGTGIGGRLSRDIEVKTRLSTGRVRGFEKALPTDFLGLRD